MYRFLLIGHVLKIYKNLAMIAGEKEWFLPWEKPWLVFKLSLLANGWVDAQHLIYLQHRLHCWLGKLCPVSSFDGPADGFGMDSFRFPPFNPLLDTHWAAPSHMRLCGFAFACTFEWLRKQVGAPPNVTCGHRRHILTSFLVMFSINFSWLWWTFRRNILLIYAIQEHSFINH